jgi:hypothetical protein
LPDLEAIADEAARQFGNVFKQPVVAVGTVDELLAHASQAAPAEDPARRAFPAEDTPLQVPDELQRLRGDGSRIERV